VDVRRVAGEEDPALAHARDHAQVQAEADDPVRVVGLRPGGDLVEQALEVGERRVVRRPGAADADDAVAAARQREEHHGALLAEVDEALVRRALPADLQVGLVEHVLVGRALEGDPREVAHRAVGPVTAEQPRRPHLLGAVRGRQRRHDLVADLAVGRQPGGALDRAAELRQPREQDLLGGALVEEARPGEPARPALHPHRLQRAAGVAHDVDRRQVDGPRLGGREHAHALEHLLRAHVQDQRLRVPAGRQRVDDPHPQPAAPQLARHRQPGRSGPDHQRVQSLVLHRRPR
jgi:hypothetical protein